MPIVRGGNYAAATGSIEVISGAVVRGRTGGGTSMRTFVTGVLIFVVASGLKATGLEAPGPAADAPPELQQFGQFVGSWSCRSSRRDRDGNWQADGWESKWTWYWVLGGHAIQDVWDVPPASPAGASLGTNLRIFDAATGTWQMVWTNTRMSSFDYYEAVGGDGEVIMTGEIPARGGRPPHSAKITFHDIAPGSFEWRYEASLAGSDGPWSEQVRISCRRTATDP